MHFFYKLYKLSHHPHQWYADCYIPLLYSCYSRKWWAGKGGKLVWYYGLAGGPLIWGIKALIRGCMGTLFEEYAMCLFLCGKQCPILFLLNLSAYFSSLKNVWKKKKQFDVLCFFCLDTKLTKETKKVLCFAKSTVWNI